MAKTGDQSAPLLPPQLPPAHCIGVPAQFHPDYEDAPAYILLPAYHSRRGRRRFSFCESLASSTTLLFTFFAATVLISSAAFLLYPSDPDLRIDGLRIHRIHVAAVPVLSIDLSLGVLLKVRNRDFFSIDYRSLIVSISYRGRKLGVATLGGGHIRARGVSYIDAELHLDGIQVISDAFYLIEDLARGSIPLETTSKIDGWLRLLIIKVPIQGKIACDMNVNTMNQSIVRQSCYLG